MDASCRSSDIRLWFYGWVDCAGCEVTLVPKAEAEELLKVLKELLALDPECELSSLNKEASVKYLSAYVEALNVIEAARKVIDAARAEDSDAFYAAADEYAERVRVRDDEVERLRKANAQLQSIVDRIEYTSTGSVEP